jgi:hypothetical protein
MSDLDDLRTAVDELRAERFPDLPADLVERLLQIEAAHVEHRGPAPRLIDAAIDDFLARE